MVIYDKYTGILTLFLTLPPLQSLHNDRQGCCGTHYFLSIVLLKSFSLHYNILWNITLHLDAFILVIMNTIKINVYFHFLDILFTD